VLLCVNKAPLARMLCHPRFAECACYGFPTPELQRCFKNQSLLCCVTPLLLMGRGGPGVPPLPGGGYCTACDLVDLFSHPVDFFGKN
jgi:hypothetical protein